MSDAHFPPKLSDCCSPQQSLPHSLCTGWKERAMLTVSAATPTPRQNERCSLDWHYTSMLSLLSTKPERKQGVSDCLPDGRGRSGGRWWGGEVEKETPTWPCILCLILQWFLFALTHAKSISCQWWGPEAQHTRQDGKLQGIHDVRFKECHQNQCVPPPTTTLTMRLAQLSQKLKEELHFFSKKEHESRLARHWSRLINYLHCWSTQETLSWTMAPVGWDALLFHCSDF